MLKIIIAVFLFSSVSFAEEKKSTEAPSAEVKKSAATKENPKKEEKSTMDQVIDTTVEVGEKAYDMGKKAVTKTNKKMGSSQRNRQNKKHSLMGNYSLMDTWIPSKIGLQYTYIQNPSTSYEASWDQGSIGYGFLFVDLAKIKDDRILLMRTSYSQRNSFYLSYGINYYKLTTTLGSKLLSGVSNNSVPSLDLIEIETLGGSFGIGNRWQFKNWVFGVNWFSIHVPIVTLKADTAFLDYTTNASDRDTVEGIVDVIKRIPTFTALRVQFGYSF